MNERKKAQPQKQHYAQDHELISLLLPQLLKQATTTNNQKPPTTANDHKRPQTTTNHQ